VVADVAALLVAALVVAPMAEVNVADAFEASQGAALLVDEDEPLMKKTR
jgi:hypothetical protein